MDCEDGWFERMRNRVVLLLKVGKEVCGRAKRMQYRQKESKYIKQAGEEKDNGK